MTVSAIPSGYTSITPYMICRGAVAALDFYGRAFGAQEIMRLEAAPGIIAHAEIKIGNAIIMLADEHPEFGALSPQAIGGTPISLMIYTEDCDAMFANAIAAGATVERPLQNQFYGDRSGMLIDPFGHRWCIATHVEDVAPDEITKRMAAQHPSP